MDIYEMHVLFRTLGQQQGLEQIRGILPESIDAFINESIIQTVRVAVLGNAQPSKDVKTPQYTKISPINQFHTLYCTEEQDIDITNEGDEVSIETNNVPLLITNFVLKYDDSKKYDCRVIESERLYQTLNDYLNRASREYPIVSLLRGTSDKEFDMNLFTGDSNKDAQSIITTYIKMPKKVYFDEEHYGGSSDSSVSCDLPEHLHTQIVETAVQIWFQSLGLTSERQSQQNNNQNN